MLFSSCVGFIDETLSVMMHTIFRAQIVLGEFKAAALVAIDG
jgi:hypothetical protein